VNNLINAKPSIKPSPLSEPHLLSIIVTSYTEKRLKDLIDLIESIKLQRYPRTEIIIVIERSKELYCKVRSHIIDSEMKNAMVIFSPNELGISEARNLGVKYAKGDIVAFTDDDAVLFPNWAEEIVKAFSQQDNIIGVTGPVLPLWEDKSLKWFPEEFYWIIGCTAWREWKREVDYGWGVNMSFRREVFETSLFTEAFTKGAHDKGKIGPVGDDREFVLNVRRKTTRPILYNPNAKVWHKVRRYKIMPSFIRRYAYWQGFSDALFKSAYGDASGRFKIELGLLRRMLSRLWPSILREFATDRSVAWRKLRTTIYVTLFFLLGYLSFLFRPLALLIRRIV
jgi:GT2 family glycosyltransferase